MVPNLMRNAGAGVTRYAECAAADLAMTLLPNTGKDVLVLAGPGNNGGDARIVARCFQDKFFRVTVADASNPPPEKKFNLVVDGLFGIGLTRPVEGDYATIISGELNLQNTVVRGLSFTQKTM